MTLLEIILLITTYLLASGYLSTIVFLSSEKMGSVAVKVIPFLIFVPGLNLLVSLFVIFITWADAVMSLREKL